MVAALLTAAEALAADQASAAEVPRPRKKGAEGERKCLVTGEFLPKEQLIRFVIGPDQVVVPDLAENLPGRGLWIKAEHDAIELAAKKNLFAKATQTQTKPDKDLPGLAGQLLHARCLSLIGLARGAGIAVLGQPQLEQAIKANTVAVLLLADDASVSFEGFIAWRNSNGSPLAVSRRFTRAELGAALGHEKIVYAGLKAHALAGKLAAELARLEKIAPMAHITSNNG